MNGVIGDSLPFAVAIAISPVPIIVAIIMLLAPGARGRALGFLGGWVVGVLASVIIFTLLSGLLSPTHDGPSITVGTIKIVLGVLLLLLALRTWRRRTRPGSEPKMPKWMSAMDKLTTGKAFTLGLLLSALNPKNLMMSVNLGVTIGSAGLAVGWIVLATVIVVVIAISTVAGPIVAYLIAPTKMATPLQHLRGWLVANNAIIVSLLLLLLGVVNIGKGLGLL